MDTEVGKKRKSQTSDNVWEEYWSPRKNHKYWYNSSTGESVWKKPLSPAQPAISSSQSFEDFLKKYDEYNKSSNNIDGIHFANGLIKSILDTKGYQEAIEYLSDLLKSYIFYKYKTSGSNLTIRDILEFNVHGTGHGGEYVAMPKDINPQYAPDKVYITAPPNIFAWGNQTHISKEYALRQHYNGNKLLKRSEKEQLRQDMRDAYNEIQKMFKDKMEQIESLLIQLRNTKEEVLSELNDPENPEAKVNIVGRIAIPMSCCPKWKDVEQKKSFYTKKDVKDAKKLFSVAKTFLNKEKTAIQEKYEHSNLGVQMSMTESFKCYDSTRLTDKRDIGQCIQTLSSGPDDWQQSYPNFDIWFKVHFYAVDYETESMFNAMLDTMQIGNESLFENREGYKLNEQGFPFLMIKQLYKTFLKESPDYRKISQGNYIYPAKLIDLLGKIGKVSIYGSNCCRKDHRVELDPNDSEGGRKKTRKRVRGNKRNRGKTRGRK